MDDEQEVPIFDDLEVDDFNVIYSTNGDVIRKQFGETINVKLVIQNKTGDVERDVEENLDLAMPLEQAPAE